MLRIVSFPRISLSILLLGTMQVGHANLNDTEQSGLLKPLTAEQIKRYLGNTDICHSNVISQSSGSQS